MKTRKVMDIMLHGKRYICIKDLTAKCNPYKLYEAFWNGGWHRKKITEYEDMDSILCHLLQLYYPVMKWDLTA